MSGTLERFGSLAGDHAHAFQKRQASLDTAHDDIDSVRKCVQELCFAALLQVFQHPNRQATAGGKAKAQRGDQSAIEKKAAALPPKLTVPMILFFLPVLFVVILGPAAIRVMETMG